MKILQALKAIKWADVAERALWTFLQAALAVFIVAGESIIDLLFNADWQALSVLLVATVVSAVAAGLSAVKTIAIEVVRNLKQEAL